jgi:hypothetical protein
VISPGGAGRALLLAALFVLPLLLALAVSADDKVSNADTPLPVPIYYLMFLFVLAGAAGVVWTLVVAARWSISKLRDTKEVIDG